MNLNFVNCALLMMVFIECGWFAVELIQTATVYCIPVLQLLCITCANTESMAVLILIADMHGFARVKWNESCAFLWLITLHCKNFVVFSSVRRMS